MREKFYKNHISKLKSNPLMRKNEINSSNSNRISTNKKPKEIKICLISRRSKNKQKNNNSQIQCKRTIRVRENNRFLHPRNNFKKLSRLCKPYLTHKLNKLKSSLKKVFRKKNNNLHKPLNQYIEGCLYLKTLETFLMISSRQSLLF